MLREELEHLRGEAIALHAMSPTGRDRRTALTSVMAQCVVLSGTTSSEPGNDFFMPIDIHGGSA